MTAEKRSLGTMVSLVGIWLAAAFVGVFGGEIVTTTGGRNGARSRVPAVVPVAALATCATLFVTWFAYRSEKAQRAPAADLGVEPALDPESTPAPLNGPVAVGHR